MKDDEMTADICPEEEETAHRKAAQQTGHRMFIFINEV